MKYEEYIKSELWQENRRRALKRDHYKCQICGSGINVRVHHIHYPKDFKYDNIDNLICLCDICHKSVHKEDISKKKNIDTFYLDREKNQMNHIIRKIGKSLFFLRYIM